jgi:hypothetical protein
VRRLAWVSFAVALFAFVLPFATVSCDGSRLEPTGADLVLRTPPDTEGTTREGIPLGELVVAYGGGLATAALLAFALSLLAATRSWTGGWATLGGLVGVAALVFLKTRGGGDGPEAVAEVDTRIGGLLAGTAGAAGALAAGAVWLKRDGRPALRPAAPVVAAGLLVFGYLYPSERSRLVSFAYADSLNLRSPWDGVFWLLPVLVGIVFLARRTGVSGAGAAFAVGILVVAAVDTVDEIQRLVRDDQAQPGVAAFAFLAGMLTAGAWAITEAWKRQIRPAVFPFAAGVVVVLLAWLAGPAS